MTKQNEDSIRILESVQNNPTYLDFWSAYKKFQQLELKPPKDPKKRIKMAIIGSSTLEPIAACLDVKSRINGLFPEVLLGGFNTYHQEALDKASFLYNKKPDIIIIVIDGWSALDKDFLPLFVKMPDAERKSIQEHLADSIASIAAVLNENTKSLILVSNLIIPVFSPLGIVDARQKLGLREFFSGVNRFLSNQFKDNDRVFVVDIDSVAARFGKSRIVNWNTYYRGSIVFSEEFLPVISDEYMRYIKAYKGLTKKCIVLDLDNTLWGGIIGEDGKEGIKLSNTSPGLEYMDFQRALLALYNRGIILAINSKNNFEDAIEVLREHPSQILKEKHFAAMRINWQNKVDNMLELAQEINIGLDNMVFIDDSVVEREQIRQALPEVLVVDVPKNPRLYRAMLENLRLFDVLSLTQEDMARGEMYVKKKKRAELQKSAVSLEDFLNTLELKVRVSLADDFSMQRVVQLIGKTNQFNLTTRRYTAAQVKELRDNKDTNVYSMAVADRFGDEGIVGVAVTKKRDSEWWVDSFLISCRVIGRSVETAFLSKIVADAKAAGARIICGEFIPTKKNAPAANFYEQYGFGKRATDSNGVTSWVLDLSEDTVDVPAWIELIEE